MKRAILMTCFVGAASLIASAQQPAPSAERRAAVELMAQAGGMARVVLETRVTKNAPYSGEAVTEFIQVLPDGNRIVRKTTTRLYRDSEGRTRRETINEAGGESNSIAITDPVAGSSLILNPANRTALRAGATFAAVAGGRISAQGTGTVSIARSPGGASVSAQGSGSVAMERVQPEVVVVPPIEPGVEPQTSTRVILGTGGASARPRTGPGQATKEDLGQQVIEGVTATGTRTTTTIPAGTIGNEQPIVTISEQWYSPELEVLVLTKHSDPRVGETTYRLTNIQRTEPDRALFQAPGDYTITNPGVRRPQ